MDHLVEGWGDKATESDDVDFMLLGRCQDLITRHHDTEIDDLVAVAGQNDTNDVLADVVDITLDGSHENLCRGAGICSSSLLGLHVGGQIGDSLLHHAGTLHNLGQEHLAGSEEITDDPHAVHERPFDDKQGTPELRASLLGIPVDVVDDPFDQGVLEALLDGAGTPGLLGLLFLGISTHGFQPLSIIHQTLRGVGPAVQEHILHHREQLRFDLLVDLEHASIHDGHVETGLDCMVEESRVHRLAHGVIAPEGEGDIAQATAALSAGKSRFDLPNSLDEVDGVVVVLLDAGGDREDIRVKDDVLGVEADRIHK